jgi:PKD repeat protein
VSLGERLPRAGQQRPAAQADSFSLYVHRLYHHLVLVANFNQSAASVVVGASLFFTDTSTTDGPSIAAWEWDFGDGSSHALSQNSSYAYEAAGVYTVTLIVTDTLGYTGTRVLPSAVTVMVDRYYLYLPAIHKP